MESKKVAELKNKLKKLNKDQKALEASLKERTALDQTLAKELERNLAFLAKIKDTIQGKGGIVYQQRLVQGNN